MYSFYDKSQVPEPVEGPANLVDESEIMVDDKAKFYCPLHNKDVKKYPIAEGQTLNKDFKTDEEIKAEEEKKKQEEELKKKQEEEQRQKEEEERQRQEEEQKKQQEQEQQQEPVVPETPDTTEPENPEG